MTANIRVLVPDETTNYVSNPALRFDTTGWSASSSTISRTLDRARFNMASLKVITNGLVNREGTYYQVTNLSGVSDHITASVYIRGTGRVHLRLIDNSFGGKEWLSEFVILRDDRWQRISVSGYSTGSGDLRMYVETDDHTQSTTFYVDGMQLERHPYPTTYCDGDQDGCRWAGLYHSSISSRPASVVSGGKWLDLAGPCRSDDDIYATVIQGAGMSSLMSQIQPWALAPGAYFQNFKVQDRAIIVQFHVKHRNLTRRGEQDLRALHELRGELIDIFNPNKTIGNDPILLEYSAGDKPLYIRVRYQSGLEGQWDIRNRNVNSFAITLIAEDPFWQQDDFEITQLGLMETFYKSSKVVDVFGRIDGQWTPISSDGSGYRSTNASASDYALSIVRGIRGEIYWGWKHIYVWDGTTSTLIGTITTGTDVRGAYCMAVAPNGDLYIGGNFTEVNGVVCNKVAKWNGSVWAPVGDTAADSVVVNDICFDDSGNLYACGTFTTIGGVAARGIAKWDGTKWNKVGQHGGLDWEVRALAKSRDGTSIYVGGEFTHEQSGGITLKAVARLDIATNVFYAIGTGLGDGTTNSKVYDLCVGKDGTIYAAGRFIVNGDGETVNYIAFWNGEKWYQLGEGGPTTITTGEDFFRVLEDPSTGDIYVAGNFIHLGGRSTNKDLSVWTGDRRSSGQWSAMDILPSQNSTPNSRVTGMILVGRDLYIVGSEFSALSSSDGFATAKAAKITSIENTGTAKVWPQIFITGPGILRSIENLETRARLSFEFTLLLDEEVIIDCAKGTIISSVRGNLSVALMPVASLKDFFLLPGTNRIAAFLTNDVDASAYIGYTPNDWSADAVVDAEALA